MLFTRYNKYFFILYFYELPLSLNIIAGDIRVVTPNYLTNCVNHEIGL